MNESVCDHVSLLMTSNGTPVCLITFSDTEPTSISAMFDRPWEPNTMMVSYPLMFLSIALKSEVIKTLRDKVYP